MQENFTLWTIEYVVKKSVLRAVLTFVSIDRSHTARGNFF